MNFSELGQTIAHFNLKSECKLSIPVCQCCLSENNLRNMFQTFVHNEKVEIYSEMLLSCLSIEVDPGSEGRFICGICIDRLRSCYLFRCQVQETQSQLKTAHYKSGIQYASYTEDIQLQSLPHVVEQFNASPNEILQNKNELLVHFNGKATETAKKSCKKEKCIKETAFSESENMPEQTDDMFFKSVSKKGNKLSNTEDKRSKARERDAKLIPFKLDITDLICQICNESFSAHKGLISHMAVHYPNHICDFCGKQFVRKEALRSHINRTHTTEKIPCNICNRLLKKHYMTRHVRTHTGEQILSNACPFCPERFISYGARMKHMSDVHNVSRGVYKCKICPRTFKSGSSRSTHFRKDHLKQKKHACTICKRAFFAKRNMMRHMVIHTGEKNYQCTVCLKSYAREFTLSEHMKIHDDVKNHKCGVCQKAFTHKTTLKNHMRTHENVTFLRKPKGGLFST